MEIKMAVVPVAGRGTRMLPLTKSQPKEMLPVGRKPVVQYVVEELSRCGTRQLLFITGPGKTAIENHFDIDGELIASLRETGKEDLLQELAYERTKVDFFYTRQRIQLGLGHAVLCAQPMVGDQPFVVALGDSMIGLQGRSDVVRRMTQQYAKGSVAGVIAFDEVPADEVIHYGIAKPAGAVEDVFVLADLVEKPSVEEAPSRMAVAARYIFSPMIFDYLKKTEPGAGNEIQLTDAIRGMISDGHRVLGMRLSADEKRYDIGNFASYFQAFAEFAMADPQYGPALRDYLRQNILK